MKALQIALTALACAQALILPSTGKDTIVIVRTHAPSDGMKRRILSMADDIMIHLPNALMLVSVDDTGLPDYAVWQVPLPYWSVHHLVWNDVKTHFPAVPWDALGRKDYLASGLNYHMETIILAVQYARRKVRIAPDAQIWVLEDDLFVCGDFSQIVKYYKNDDSDLLTNERRQVTTDWPNWDMSSAAFADRYPMSARQYSMQFAERFSSRFLDYIHRLSRDDAVTAQSEMFAPTVCYADGFKQGFFNQSHVGNSSSWYFSARLTPTSAQWVCHNQPMSMHHAAKFFYRGGF